MENEQEIDEFAINRIEAHLEKLESVISSILCKLYGKMPQWVPKTNIDIAKRNAQFLVIEGFSLDEICQLVAEAEKGELSYPGIVINPVYHSQSIYELLSIRYAISLGKSKGLLLLGGEQAQHGQKFMDGRKPGTSGEIRKAIAKLLAKNPVMTNPELWDSIKKKPPKRWIVEESPHFKLEPQLLGPKPEKDHMSRRRFNNVCGEERKKVKGKITG